MSQIRPCFNIIPPLISSTGSMEKFFDQRFKLVTMLIYAYDLRTKIKFIASDLADEKDLKSFHASDYIDFLKNHSLPLSTEKLDMTNIVITKEMELELEEFGLTYDCELTPTIYYFCLAVTGATLKAVDIINNFSYSCKSPAINEAPICINWSGGWHHAKRSSASGYCYVNDIVIAITELKKVHRHILYIDLDLHHGDGVEEAFSALRNKSIMTVSFHHYSPGFYPGTGGCTLELKNSYETTYPYNLNIPLKEGINDATYFYLFQVGSKNCAFFVPDVIIIQCGADTLITDPNAKFNLTSIGVGACVDYIMQICPATPLLLLGGGGYSPMDAAKCWTQITANVCNMPLSPDIPEHIFFPLYGPSYELEITPGLRRDQNNSSYLDKIILSTMEKLLNFESEYDSA